MTIRTKNQVFLSGDIPVYGGPNGGASLNCDFMLKFDEYDPDSTPPNIVAAKANGNWPLFSWGTSLGTQVWEPELSAMTFPGVTDILEWDGGLPSIGATDDAVGIVVCSFSQNASELMTIGDAVAADGFQFQTSRTRINAVNPNQDDNFTNHVPVDTVVGMYFRGVGAVNFTGNSGWRARSDSGIAIRSEDTAEKTYTGAMTMDLTSVSSKILPRYCTAYSVFFAVYDSGFAPSLAAVKRACQWHVDNHSSKESFTNPATNRVPYHEL